MWASQSAFLQVVSLTTLWGSSVLLVLGGWCPPWYLGPSFFGCFRCISHFSFLLCCLWSPLGRKPDQTVPPMKMHSMAAWQTLLRVYVDISCHEKRQRETNMDVNNAGSHIQFKIKHWWFQWSVKNESNLLPLVDIAARFLFLYLNAEANYILQYTSVGGGNEQVYHNNRISYYLSNVR